MNCCISGEELTLLCSMIALYLAQGLNDDELNVLGTLFQTIGQNLSLIAAQRSACANVISGI